METIVGVTRGADKTESFKELLTLTNFDDTLIQVLEKSKKDKKDFKIVIKANMMVYINPKAYKATVTDKELVEFLVDHIIQLGYSDISVCEAQNDVGTMLKNHNVRFVANQIGYTPEGRYKIVDLTDESHSFEYLYKNKQGQLKTWKDKVGKTWKQADFRNTFAKCKTHEQDWMTLGLKNVYGCFPTPGKTCIYHIRHEVPDVTARSLRNFPVHFSFIDGWEGSDGYQGHKVEHPKQLKMFFGGENVVAVDMEVFKRAGLDPKKSELQEKVVEQLYDGVSPQYVVKGDQDTMFKDICDWENLDEKLIKSFDFIEEIYIAAGLLNLRVIAEVVDFDVFPPKNFFQRLLVWISKKLYRFLKVFGL